MGIGRLVFLNSLFMIGNMVFISLGILRVFKFFDQNAYLSFVGRTFQHAGDELAYFICIFFLIFFLIAQIAVVILGTKQEGYNSYGNSFYSLLGIAFTNQVNFEQFDGIGFVGVVFIFGFIMFIIMIMLQMFLAIVLDGY